MSLIAPALISAVLLICWLLPLAPWFQFDREAVGAGQVWRLLTGNLVHINAWHLLANLAGLWLIHWWVGEWLPTGRWLTVVTLCALGVTLGLYLQQPEVLWYQGFSGVLYGLFAAGSVFMLPHHRYLAMAGLVLVAMKLVADQAGLLEVGVASVSDFEVIHQAHNYGFATGALMALVWSRFSGRSESGFPQAGN